MEFESGGAVDGPDAAVADCCAVDDPTMEKRAGVGVGVDPDAAGEGAEAWGAFAGYWSEIGPRR